MRKRLGCLSNAVDILNGGLRMTCLQTCSYKRNARADETQRRGRTRFIAQSFADLWVAIVYASLAGFAALAIDASDGGRPSLTMWGLCSVVPPVAASLLIVIDALVRNLADRRPVA